MKLRFLLISLWIALISIFLVWSRTSPEEEKTINVFTWGSCIDPAQIEKFERTTGYRVNINYYSSNEELLTKMRALNGKSYDLLIPSDYVIKLMREEGLLKPVDKSRVTVFNQIDPLLLNHDFDPNNCYSIPYQWDILGFGYNREFFADHPVSFDWDLVFQKPSFPYKIAMTNDPVEAIDFGSFYLYSRCDILTPPEVDQIEALLMKQRDWVESYTAMRADYILATKSVPLAFSQSSYIMGAFRHSPFIEFVLPKKGTFLSIENFCIPATSDKDDLTYALINYLFEEEIVRHSSDVYAMFPATPLDNLLFAKEYNEARAKLADPDYQIEFFRHPIPEKEIRTLWIKVKS